MQYQASKTTEEIFPKYFPFFNHTLFIEEAEFSKEDDSQIDNSELQMSEESSTNTSHLSIDSSDEKEKLIPLNLLDVSPVKNPSNNILPKSLFDNIKTKKKEVSDDLDEKKLNAKPFIPSKYKNQSSLMNGNPANFFGAQNKNAKNLFGYELKLKNKKKKFVEREGDWRCAKCKNINFSFREKCNKCQISKQESENFCVTLKKNLFKLDKNVTNL